MIITKLDQKSRIFQLFYFDQDIFHQDSDQVTLFSIVVNMNKVVFQLFGEKKRPYFGGRQYMYTSNLIFEDKSSKKQLPQITK